MASAAISVVQIAVPSNGGAEILMVVVRDRKRRGVNFSMEAHPRRLKSVFRPDVRLVVPLFQRPYVWDEEEQ